MFNTEAHPIDTAALYCCSAERKEHDKLIHDFHDNVDLLALLDILDDAEDMFSLDNLPESKQKSIRPPRKKPFEPHLDTIAVEVPVPSPTVTINVQASSSATESASEGQQAVVMNVDNDKSDDHGRVEQKLQQLVKISGEPNVDLTVKKILSSLKELSDNVFKTGEAGGKVKIQVSEDGRSFQRSSFRDLVKQAGKKTSDEENSVCRDEDRLYEEQKNLFESEQIRRAELREKSYIQGLFTCPAQPFQSRLSLMGEMFIVS